jgi:AraC family transcriptional regulator
MNKKEKSRKEYIARINKVMDYIENHIDQPVDLNTLSQIACFSPYHFHRIFTFLVGETPNNFLQRLRIEKAAHFLKNYPEISITEIAYKCGFNSVSVFSRIFRKYFDTTAKNFREKELMTPFEHNEHKLRYCSKNNQTVSNIDQSSSVFKYQLCNVEFKHVTIMKTKIEVKEMPEMKVVYCRHTGAFDQITKAYDKLEKWAAPRGLLKFPETKMLTIYHDDPSITSIDKVRQDACITVDSDIKVDGEIGKMIVERGKYAVGHFEITETGFQEAWNTMCAWFTESGYQQGDGNSYELYYNDHTEHPEKKFILDICIPVKLL